MVEFYLAILLMLVTAWLLGGAFHKLGQPALVGQLLAGVIIGPSILGVVQPTADLSTIENVALFFIMLLTGLAVRPDKIIAAGRRGLVVSSVAFALPFLAGFLVARAFGVGEVSSLTVGLTVSITAVPANTIILIELGLIDTNLGATVIAAGVIDDVFSFIALGIIQQVGSGGTISGDANIVLSIFKIAVFLGAVLICERVLRRSSAKILARAKDFSSVLRSPGSNIVVLLIFTVAVSLLAEWSGLQLVIGAFFAGLLASEVVGVERLSKTSDVIQGATFGFFGPIAFTFIGTEFVLSSIIGIPLLFVVLLAAAIATKLFGGYVGARLSGFASGDSMTIGFLMNSRGFVELVIATSAFQLGLIDESIFSLVVAVGIIATIISPVAARLATKRKSTRQARV